MSNIYEVGLRDLRHTFASGFMMDGNNLYDLSKLLGHTKVEMTTRYAHLAPDYLQSTMKDFNMGLIETKTEFGFNQNLTMNLKNEEGVENLQVVM